MLGTAKNKLRQQEEQVHDGLAMADSVVSRVLRQRYEPNKKEPNIIDKASGRKAVQDWRERLKQDEGRYKAFREAENIRLKLYRRNLSEEKRKHHNELAKSRMAKYRARQKAEGKLPSVAKVKTRASTEAERRTWRDAKRSQRQNQTSQKKRRVNERRRARYAEKKLKSKNADTQTGVTGFLSALPYTSEARRKAVSRSLRVLPKHSEHFAEVISHIVSKSTPRKKAELSKRFITSPASKKRLDFYTLTSSSITDKIRQLRNRRKDKDNRLRRLLHSSLAVKGKFNNAVVKQFGLSRKLTQLQYNSLDSACRKRRKDAIPQHQIQAVEEFFESCSISRELPLPRLVSSKKPKKVLDGSLVKSYEKFKQQHPEIKISYSKFVSVRPPNVVPMAQQKHYQCLCEYCVNVEFKVKSLLRFCVSKGLESPAVDKYDASRLTLCSKEQGSYKKACIDRECDMCGVKRLAQKTETLVPYFDEKITWQKWQHKEASDQPSKKFMALTRMEGKVRELLEELKDALHTFSKHLFNAKWQADQFEYMKKNIPKAWVMLCMDFGENYACHHQDEAQGAHWHYDQVTIHPVVAYYVCPVPGCNQPMHESIVFVSDDHKHDCHAVQHFIKQTNEYLFKTVGLKTSKEIIFSDGAPAQYKSKSNFVDLSFGGEDFGIDVEKHYFGSRHGKGPCDGEVGVVKRSATVAVKSRQTIISGAADFYEFAKANLTQPKDSAHCHAKRTFFFVPINHVIRDHQDRQNRFLSTKAVPQTRMLHQFKGVSRYVVSARERSCFCGVCIGTEDGRCENESITGNWKVHTLGVKKRQAQRAVVESTPVVEAEGNTEELPPLNVQTTVAITEATSQPLPALQAPQNVTLLQVPQDVPTRTMTSTGLTKSLTAKQNIIYRPGQFVKVTLSSDQRTDPHVFVAEILEATDGEVLLNFMVEDRGRFYWPNPGDVAWETTKNIQAFLSPPSLLASSSRRWQYFKFD